MKQALLWLWQAPQHIAALLFRAVLRLAGMVEKTYSAQFCKDITVVRTDYFGLSLGEYIFVGKKNLEGSTLPHEHGHTLQSRRLGPLYLLVIGIPSISGNIYNRIKKKGPAWYYEQPWEAWADKLGGVSRK